MPFELTILGSSSALPTSERYPTAQVLNVSGHLFLIDCGEGTQIQLRRYKINFSKIKHIFISHRHGDHYYGLIGLISTMNLLGIKSDLHIFAPSEIQSFLQPQLADIRGENTINPIFHPLNFKKKTRIYTNKKVEVFSFPLKHSIPACGFLFKEVGKQANIKKEMIAKYSIPIARIKDIKSGADFITNSGEIIPNQTLTIPPPAPRSYAFCTDTAYYPQLASIVKNVDLLYHETTFPEAMREFAERTRHSTTLDAARIAYNAQVKKLLIGHFSARFHDTSLFEKEAREIFANTIAVREGDVYSVEKKS
ncbi:MAG: ribonuclease [Draconibacterium sp.]|nr:MAG: ribonuclease [Draconibacterium sp.]